MSRPPAALTAALTLPVAALLAACGGKGAVAPVEAKAAPAIDADPYALLPPSAIGVARVEAKAVFASHAIGSEVAALADSFVPLGDDSGFHASRDVERVVVGTYATSGNDVAAVLVGHFDVDKIAHATKTKHGVAVVSEPHGAQTLYRAGRDAWAPIAARTLVAGTPQGVTEVLDRIAKVQPGAALARWEPAWMTETLETPSTVFAYAADFASRPLTAAAIGAIRLPWLNGIHQVRATGAFKGDALDVDATASYGSPAQAKDGEDGVRHSVQMLDVLGAVLGGLRLQSFDAKVDGQDLRCTFSLDAQTLHALVDLAPKLLPSNQ
jgi:hypothetical protein